MPGLSPTGWLCVDGTELVNHYRTLTYLLRGLGSIPGLLEIGRTARYAVGSTYIDVYGNPHVVDRFSPMNLVGWCEQGGDPAGYVSPAADGAPWYVAARPESGEFLGVVLTNLDVRPVAHRSAVKRARGGGKIGPMVPAARSASAEAWLIASTAAGMEYGRRWVADLLTGGLCGCGTGEVVFLAACPDDPTVDTGYRRLASVGLVDGPYWDRIGRISECNFTTATWQWIAGVPWLLAQPEDAGALVHLAPGTTTTFQVDTGDWVGDNGVYVKLSCPDGAVPGHGITVKAYPVPDGGSCPLPGTPNPCHEWTCPTLPPNTVLEVDSATEQAIWHDATAKTAEPAWPHLTLDTMKPWEWLVVPPCSTVCVQVSSAAGPYATVDVTVQRVAREA